MSSILIIGGAGFIGSNLSHILCEQGFKITVVDQFNVSISNPDIKFIQGNFADTNFLGALFRKEKFDVVIHLISTLIPSSDYSDFNNSKDLNSFATFELIRIMLENNSDKLIYFSSGGTIYGNCNKDRISEDEKLQPQNYYGFSKLLIEEYIQLQARINNLKYVIIRPSNPYGKGQKAHSKQGLIAVALGKILNNKSIDIWGDGSVIRDYLHVSDLCFSINKILKSNKWSRIYNIGSGEGISVNNLLNLIENTINKKAEINYFQSRFIDVPSNVLDISKIKEETDWEPKVTLKDGIKDLWDIMSKY
jgi:UDP-glucose 4-epimerase